MRLECDVSEYETLLREAYLGEIFGAALFNALAEAQPDAERREKLRTLETVEARTATTLQRLVAKAGMKLSGEEPKAREDGRRLAAAINASDWDGFVRSLHDALPPFLEKFERLREVGGTPVDPALTALVNHERAIQRFAELELAGDKHPTRPLTDHLRKPA
jgi:hypothetical protein